MTDNCTLLLVLSASEDARTNRHRCGFGALRCRWCVLRMCTCMHARARACTRASGVRVFGTRPTLASLPVYVYPLPSRRVVVTAQLYPQKPVFRLSHSPGNRERDWRRPSPYREKAKDLLLPPDEHRNRLEIGTAIRCFFSPPFFFSFHSHRRTRFLHFAARRLADRPAQTCSRILNAPRTSRPFRRIRTSVLSYREEHISRRVRFSMLNRCRKVYLLFKRNKKEPLFCNSRFLK